MTKELLTAFMASRISFEGRSVDVSELETLKQSYLDELPKSIEVQHVALLESNPLHFAIKFFLLLDLKAVPVLLSSSLTDHQLEAIRSHNPDWHFWVTLFEESKVPNTSLYNSCFAAMTSGSTGRPKLCYLGIENSLLNAKMHGESLGLDDTYQCIQSLPVYHSFGIVTYLFSLLVFNFSIDFNRIFLGLKGLKKRKLNKAFIHLSPSQVRFILKEKTDVPDEIVLISIGGGRISTSELKGAAEKFSHSLLFVTYGLTEAGPRVTTHRVVQGLYNQSIGRPIGQVECAVLIDDNIGGHGVGQLLVKTPTLKLNTAEDELCGGYLLTRDRVEITEFGEVFYHGREQDIINVGGVTLYAADIEETMRTCLGVNDAFVFALDHPVYGEVVGLAIESEVVDSEQAKEFLKDKLTTIQLPKKIHVLSHFPRTGLGKIDRAVIREMINEQS